MSNYHEATPLRLKDYTNSPRTGVLRRDVYEAKFGSETIDIAFQIYDVITQWHPSWAELFSYTRLQKVAQKFQNQIHLDNFISLPQNSQQTLISIINNCTRHSFQQLLTVMQQMNSQNFSGFTKLLLDMNHLFHSDPRSFVSRGDMSRELYDLVGHDSILPLGNHHLAYIISASRLFGENSVIEVFQYAKDQNFPYRDLDLVNILSQWETMKEYPLPWIVSFSSTDSSK